MPTAHLIGTLVINSLTLVVGLILLITASIFLSDIDYIGDIDSQIYTLSLLSVIIGALSIIIASGLIIWIIKQFPILTTVFSCLLFIVVLLAITCAIILLTGLSQLEAITLNQTTTIFNNYSDSNNIQSSKRIVERIQQSLECCGIQNATDWANRASNRTSTPDSCCKHMTPNCGTNALITLNGIYFDGCAQSIYLHFNNIYTILIGMNFSIAIIASASCVLALYLRIFMRRRYSSF